MTERAFIDITHSGEFVTSSLPAAETIVEVKLRDGSIRLAWFDCHIMESGDLGDYDFIPIEPGEDEPDIERDSISDQVVAWRRLEE
jgi:hypothetical protein